MGRVLVWVRVLWVGVLACMLRRSGMGVGIGGDRWIGMDGVYLGRE